MRNYDRQSPKVEESVMAETWTTSEVAAYLDKSYNAAYKFLRRNQIAPVARDVGRDGENRYPAAAVKKAAKNAPGRGYRSDLARKKETSR